MPYPSPLHPGVRIALARWGLNELGLARAIAAGELISPQHYENLWLFAIRITGTGAAYRRGLEEHVWRSPDHYLNNDFVARCNGLPVIIEHPETGTLDADEYHERNVGSIMLPFVRGNEVWGIARIYDEALAILLQDEQQSTSPCVVFRDGQTTDLGNGEHLLIEGAPLLLDHIAICAAGVWDKGGPPSGIDSQAAEDTAMAEDKKAAERGDAAATETEKEEREDSARMDAHNDLMTKLDAISAKLDSAHSRLDAFEKERGDKERKDAAEEDEKKEERKDAEDKDGDKEERADKARRDAAAAKDKSFGEWAKEEEKEPEHRDDAETEEEKMALKKAEEAKDDAARKDAARADAAEKEARNLKAELAEIRQMLRREVSAEERDDLAAAQSRADSVMALFGKRAPLPNVGETLLGYRRRLLRPLMQHSTHLKDARVDSADAATLDLIERQVFADARDASRVRADAQPGVLVPRTSTDAAGRTITTYEGDMLAWLAPFMTDGARCTINRNPNGR